AVPGLGVFAACFTGLAGAMVVLAVARSGRPRLRLPVPAPTVLVAGAGAASITVTVIFLRRGPAAPPYPPPPAAAYLPALLAGCLWVALAAPRRRGAGRLAPHLGAAGAVVFAASFLVSYRLDGTQPRSRSCSCSHSCSCSRRSPPCSSRHSRRGGLASRSARACRPPPGPRPPPFPPPSPPGPPKRRALPPSTRS